MLLFLIWNWRELMRARRGLLVATSAKLFTSLCSFTCILEETPLRFVLMRLLLAARVQTERADVATHPIIPDVRGVFFDFAVPGEVAAQNCLASRL